MRRVAVLIWTWLCVATSVSGQPLPSRQVKPDWIKVTERAGWQPRDSQGELVHDDKLWIFGGWFNSFEAPPRDVWSSADGKNWRQVAAQAPWIHSDLSMSLTFRNRMWFMGGWYNGRLPGHSASNQVWSSRDGIDWTRETDQAGWSPRLASSIVEHRGRMWILGGTENYYFGDAASLKNDVWFSEDGRNWRQATARASWKPRAYHQAVVLQDRIYLFGGGNYVPEYAAWNDVWSSADGVEWRLETAHAPWPARLWFPAVVYRDHIWVLGGWSGEPATNRNDVWYSKNGRDWSRLETESIWKERHEHSAFVFQDCLWIAGGHAQPLSSEVWSLRLPPDWNGSNPRSE
ncbi:MAG: galactose oxidase [Planctomycetaceae bacterium]|nr:galactose oxidase [Planctomycetaceae bacterium]